MSVKDCVMKRNTKRLRIRCCVHGCNNLVGSPEFEFYRIPAGNKLFPHKVARRTAWLNAMRLVNPDGSAWVPKEWHRICSEHFVGNKKSEDPRSPSYNPTIFPNTYKKRKINSEQATNRYKRHLKRTSAESKDVSREIKKIKSEDNFFENLTMVPLSIVAATYKEEVVQKEDKAVQVDFLESGQEMQNTFICIHHMTCTGCDAETQAYRPVPKMKISNSKVENVSKNDHISVSVKEEEKGFRGYSSIKHEQEMLDLGGVTLNTFQQLLKLLANDSEKNDGRKKISNENRLLIFLVKIKCGLSFSALSVLFNVHRSTISRIFFSTLHYFHKISPSSPTKLLNELIPS